MNRPLGLERPQNVNHFIGPSAVSHHIAQVPELVEASTDATARYSQHCLKSLQISVNVRNYQRAHKQPVKTSKTTSPKLIRRPTAPS
jgi:hypothetical protein